MQQTVSPPTDIDDSDLSKVIREKTLKWLWIPGSNKSPLPLTDPRDAVPQAHSVVDGQCDKLVTETVTSLPHW